jgi:hypothetical protein
MNPSRQAHGETSRAPGRRQRREAHGDHPGNGRRENPVRTALRRAGILVDTVARVTILGRDGVDL